MTIPLRALFVEDSDDDVALALHDLRRQGYEPSMLRVESEAALLRALAEGTWDVVLSDWSMPSFDALAALAIVRARDPDLPFIIISGTIGEDAAVQGLKAGADDFMVKGKLSRLGPAIERELRLRESRTARREAERAQGVAELRFRRLWECGIVAIGINDASGAVIEANGKYLEMLGYTQDDLAARRLDWHTLSATEWRETSARARRQLAERGFAETWEEEYLRKDGSRVPVVVGAATIEGTSNISIVLDQTDRKRLEEDVRRAQKLDAIGALAGGIAHDFNNLMSVVLSYATLAAEGLAPGDPLAADLEEIRLAGERAAELTAQLLAFSRKQIRRPRTLDVNRLTSGMAKLLRRLIGDSIELKILTAPVLGTVHADPTQLEQVVMNLAVNARDAMTSGGRLTIETANAEIGEGDATAHAGIPPGSYVLLEVSDTGAGMDAAAKARMFEPFFSTRPIEKGTGLGLATVYGIVRQSDGHIEVDTEVGRGTTFRVYLPRVDQVIGEDPPQPLEPASLRGTETILLVEDEDQLRAIVRTILRRQGYEVLEAQNGGEAFLISQELQSPIHLMITDVIMPRMSGPVLAKRLAAERPDMKVLFVSGYNDGEIVHQGVVDAGVAFLPKPLSPLMLAKRVRELLDGS